MFCMNCGQELPQGAKFCMKCGTPLGVTSPLGSDSTNNDGTRSFVPAMCPNCNSHMRVDPTFMIARCETCGTECLVQDAIKTLSSVTVKANVQVDNATFNVSGTNSESLMQRIEIMLADGDFSGAWSKCDAILDSEPTNGKVYFYMLMSNIGCRTKNDLANQLAPFDSNQYYKKAIQYGDENLKAELAGYINTIIARNNAKLTNPQIGDYLYFGIYNHNRIWWQVLRIESGKALIISWRCIRSCVFHVTASDDRVTWKDCTLRKWLNTSFIDGSFSPEEQGRIYPIEVKNSGNPKYGTSGDDSTTDKVFLLSIDEAESLFNNDVTRACDYFWWLRSPGVQPDYVAGVTAEGNIRYSGYRACPDSRDISYMGVRPAMWIKLDS